MIIVIVIAVLLFVFVIFPVWACLVVGKRSDLRLPPK